MRIYALILAGGRSSRFGSDKALAELAGRPLIAHVADVLRPSATAMAVSGGREAAAMLGALLLRDPADCPKGPLAGILAGLQWAEESHADWLVTTSCDVPLIPADMATRLIDAAHASDAELAVARTDDGLHPLCAVWRPRLRARLAEALSRGAHPAVRQFAAQVHSVEVAFPERDDFLNVNSASDIVIAERRLAARQRRP
ncbi:MAG: molybdenum cofactor guanylyltransferase [Bradyrhizobium sp.]|nr:MAG: molybdenum cofactor guanylyltransferase [Bradyrhizobium sp.]